MGVTRCHTPFTINKDTDRVMYGGRMDVVKVMSRKADMCEYVMMVMKG